MLVVLGNSAVNLTPEGTTMSARISYRNGRAEFSYTGDAPWWGLADKVDRHQTVSEAFARTLPWTVSLREVRFSTLDANGGRAFDADGGNLRVIARDDNNAMLGYATKSYREIQNSQAGEVVDALVAEGAECIETIGALDEGARCFCLVSLSRTGFEVGAGDRVNPYFLLAWGHDGRHPVAGKLTSVRVVCNNTLTAAGFGEGRWSTAAGVSFKHNASAKVRIDEAREALGLARKATEETQAAYKRLLARALTTTEARDYFASLFPYPAAAQAGETTETTIARLMGGASSSARDIAKAAREAMERVDETRDVLAHLLARGKGASMAGQTAWGAYNAVTEFVDHVYPVKANGDVSSTRQQSALFGSYADLKADAFDSALALAAV
jgi:phage/plasmid-like protein (TIGR03299 family)